jgi:hypothetical protein
MTVLAALMTSMASDFSRSAADRELLILDPMFAARVPRSSLFAENYSEWFNVPSHDLTPEEVDEILRSLVQRRLVTLDSTAGWYGLSLAGGSMWEGKRRPDWSKYCIASTTASSGGLSSLRITAMRRDLGQDCLRLTLECGMYSDLTPAVPSWSPCESPIYWKPDLRAWTADCQVRENDTLRAQATRFAKEKRWWSELRDLTLPDSPFRT